MNKPRTALTAVESPHGTGYYAVREIPNQARLSDWYPINHLEAIDQASQTLRNESLRIAFLAVHNRLTGGAKIFFEHANQLYLRRFCVAILSRESKPDWIRLNVPWIQIPQDEDLAKYTTHFDIVVGMFWTAIPEMLRCNGAVRVLLEQGDPSLFELERLPEQTRRFMLACYHAPVNIITVSHHLSHVLKQNLGRESIIIPNAIDLNLFRPAPKPPRNYYSLILVGADELAFKGIQDGLIAARILQEKGYPVKLVQVSSGGRVLYEIERKIVVRPDPVTLVRLYQEADVYLCCSWYESFPLPPLEAMACGTPVISTENGGIREYGIPEKNCLLVPPRDPAALANQLERMLTDQALRERLTEGGLATARNFSWDKASAAFARALLAFAQDASENKHAPTLEQKILTYQKLACDLVDRGEFEAAREFTRTALALNPQDVDSLFNLAYVSLALHEDEDGLNYLNQALRINPNHKDAILLLSALKDGQVR